MDKTIINSDALEWIERHEFTENQAIVASIPDRSELPNSAVEPWRQWFTLIARRLIERTHERSLMVFYQSDVRHEGIWIDKSYLIQQEAEKAGAKLLSHRIVCRRPPGTTSFGRSTYSHLMLVSKGLRNSQKFGYTDVIPDGGPAAWVRGIGLHSCEAIVRMIRQESTADTLVHLFCGKGLLLEVARKEGLHALGIDLSKKQCRAAQRFSLEKFLARGSEPPPVEDP